MFLNKMKISQKVLSLVIAGVIVSISFSAVTIVLLRKQVATLEEIYKQKLIPLDNLRKIQLIFRELEFRMAAVKAGVVAPIGSGEHLKNSLKDVDRLWSQTEGSISADALIEQKNKFQKGYDQFKVLAADLQKYYFDQAIDKVQGVIDNYLDIKGLIFKSLDKMAEAQEASVGAYYLERQQVTRKMITAIVIVSIFLMAGFVFFAVLIIRSINKPLAIITTAAETVASGNLSHRVNIDSRDEMGAMASELNNMLGKLREAFSSISREIEIISSHAQGLSRSADSLLKGTSQQTAQIEQVSTSTTEMSQTIIDMAKNATDASDSTRESLGFANNGAQVVQQAVESLLKLADNVENASAAIEILGKSTEQISSILTVIKEIADQTNLLALNAAIEAARAGDQGRGFAVVADEVRKLAEKTATATKQIAEKIKSVQEETRTTVSVMNSGKTIAEEAVGSARQAEEALHKIVTSSNRVADTVQRIATATEEQSSAAEEISQSMEHIADVIKESSRLSEDVQKAAKDLSTISDRTKQQIAQFKTDAPAEITVAETRHIAFETQPAST